MRVFFILLLAMLPLPPSVSAQNINADPIRLDNLRTVADISDYMRRTDDGHFVFSIQNGNNETARFILQRHRHSDVLRLLTLADPMRPPVRLFGSDNSEFAAPATAPDLAKFSIPPNSVLTFRLLGINGNPPVAHLWAENGYASFLERRALFRNVSLLLSFATISIGLGFVWRYRSRRGIGALAISAIVTAILLLIWKPHWFGWAPLNALDKTITDDYNNLVTRQFVFWLALTTSIGLAITAHITLLRQTLENARYWQFIIICLDIFTIISIAICWAAYQGQLNTTPLINDIVELMFVLIALALACTAITVPRKTS